MLWIQYETRCHQVRGNEVAIRVMQKVQGTDSGWSIATCTHKVYSLYPTVWSIETLEKKIAAMRESFQKEVEGQHQNV